MSYHIIIKQEQRKPIITERQVYVGEYLSTTEIDEDGDEMTVYSPADPTAYETVIDVDRSRMAQAISKAIPTGKMVDGFLGKTEEYEAGPEQLHSHTNADLRKPVGEGDKAGLVYDFSDPQFVMVAEWDGKTHYVICHKGDYSKRTLSYAGWPTLTKDECDAIPVPDPL